LAGYGNIAVHPLASGLASRLGQTKKQDKECTRVPSTPLRQVAGHGIASLLGRT
jgi:hypothetical protein